MTNTQFVIVKGGMGAMLNPPGDVEHKYSVAEKTKYGATHGTMSVRHALAVDYIPDEIKNTLRNLLNEHKGELTDAWEHSCYNYFRNCYSPDGTIRDVSKMVVDNTNNLPATSHLAVLHIQSYFPDYKPNEFLISNNGDSGSWSAK